MDKERAKGNLRSILEKIHTDASIIELREYQKVYKKEISLFKRSWAAAWLFMYYDKRETPADSISGNPGEGRRPSYADNAEKTFSQANNARKGAPDKPPPEFLLGEEESKRLFFSIGKNRKLFPREVITLIMANTKAAREDIGMIKILDNYSFVQVRDTRADEIIEKLTGYKFRGRTLTVNYAKPKAAENDEDNS